jgi:ATP-binding cassette subfamily B protein
VFELLDSPEEAPDEPTQELTGPIRGDVSIARRLLLLRQGAGHPRHFGEAKSGQRVAIVGPTGSGRTTLVNLLLPLLRGRGGDILIDAPQRAKHEPRAAARALRHGAAGHLAV